MPAPEITSAPPEPLPNARVSRLNVADAIAYLDGHAEPASTGACAAYVRAAIQAGGLALSGHPRLAKNYRATLLNASFTEVPAGNYTAQAGDVVAVEGAG